jgi:hypothetical protein
LVGPDPIGAPEHEVTARCSFGIRTAKHIVKARRGILESKAQSTGLARPSDGVAAGSWVTWTLISVGSTRSGRDLFPRAGARINESGVLELSKRSLVRFIVAGLEHRAFVPVETEPFVVAAYLIGGPFDDPRFVDVLYAHHNPAPLFASLQPSHEGRSCVPGVHLAGR